jgi:hypothetical protein
MHLHQTDRPVDTTVADDAPGARVPDQRRTRTPVPPSLRTRGGPVPADTVTALLAGDDETLTAALAGVTGVC